MTEEIKLTGDAYAIRSEIKAAGGRWDKTARPWYVPAESGHDLQQKLDHMATVKLREKLGRQKFEELYPDIAISDSRKTAELWMDYIENAIEGGRHWYEKGEKKTIECRKVLARLGQDVSWIDQRLHKLHEMNAALSDDDRERIRNENALSGPHDDF